jgi:hypothetical protein
VDQATFLVNTGTHPLIYSVLSCKLYISIPEAIGFRTPARCSDIEPQACLPDESNKRDSRVMEHGSGDCAKQHGHDFNFHLFIFISKNWGRVVNHMIQPDRAINIAIGKFPGLAPTTLRYPRPPLVRMVHASPLPWFEASRFPTIPLKRNRNKLSEPARVQECLAMTRQQ